MSTSKLGGGPFSVSHPYRGKSGELTESVGERKIIQPNPEFFFVKRKGVIKQKNEYKVFQRSEL